MVNVKTKNLTKFALAYVIIPWGCLIVLSRSIIVHVGNKSDIYIAATYIGSFVSCYYILFSLTKFYCKFLRVAKDVTTYGKWAIVTGATSGIGNSYCEELLKKGMSVLLISRNEEKLKQTQRQLEILGKEKGKVVDIEYFVCDFDNISSDDVTNLKSKLSQLGEDGGLGMLVYCAGIVNDLPAILHECDSDIVQSIMNVNMNGYVAMCQIVLPLMMMRQKGAIINVSSGSCTHPSPMLSTYSATKSFALQMTRSLHYEYKEYGIDCLAIYPYYFRSNMYRAKEATVIIPDPDVIVKASLPLLGYESEAYPYWGHCLLGCIIDKLSFAPTGESILKMGKRNRKRMVQKKAKIQ